MQFLANKPKALKITALTNCTYLKLNQTDQDLLSDGERYHALRSAQLKLHGYFFTYFRPNTLFV